MPKNEKSTSWSRWCKNVRLWSSQSKASSTRIKSASCNNGRVKSPSSTKAWSGWKVTSRGCKLISSACNILYRNVSPRSKNWALKRPLCWRKWRSMSRKERSGRARIATWRITSTSTWTRYGTALTCSWESWLKSRRLKFKLWLRLCRANNFASMSSVLRSWICDHERITRRSFWCLRQRSWRSQMNQNPWLELRMRLKAWVSTTNSQWGRVQRSIKIRLRD